MKYLVSVLASVLFINSNGQKLDFEKYTRSESLKGGKLAFYAYNVDKNEVVEEFNANEWVAPASALKLITTSVAVEKLGADFKFKTRLAYRGKIEEGVLKGDLILIGGGDPTIGFNIEKGEPEFPTVFFENLIASLNDNGIQSVEGNLIADLACFETNPVPSGWTWSDIGNYYGAGSHALNIYGNRYSVFLNQEKWKEAEPQL